ncbi:MAG: hypothetical protein IPO37_03445 [Saprospiraceae bacterium]|jgi:hypothetical protein|nr:hypothetical protein [Saprospiraceae bacterium]MBP6448330.1 hypothetical protein [Saprospiraceae bacterium]
MKSLIVILIIFMLSCNNPVNKNRPSNVPENAIWKGGSDGGCWIIINPIAEGNLECKVFYENGDVWEEGTFIKNGDCNIDQSEALNQITGFDGENILTKTKCKYTLK